MSTLKVNTIQNTSGVEVYTAKAWVNFNGTGTVAIRAAGNVSSITDVGTGYYTVNFTNAMSDASYSAYATAASGGSGKLAFGYSGVAPTSSTFTFQTTSFAGSNEDQTYVAIAIFR